MAKKNQETSLQRKLKTASPELPPGFRLVGTLLGPQFSHRLAWSPSGDLIAAASSSGRVNVWQVNQPNPVASFDAAVPIYSIAFSPDGEQLAFAGNSGWMYLCDPTKAHKSESLSAHARQIWGLAFAPNGLALATGSDDGTVKLWHLKKRKWDESVVIRIDSEQFWHVAFSPDSTLLAACSTDAIVRVWNLESEVLRFELLDHRGPALTLAFSPSAPWLAAACSDGTIPIWNYETGRLVAVLDGHLDRVDGISFSSDGSLLASKSADGTVKLWRLDRLEVIAKIKESTQGNWIASVAFHPQLPMLATLDEANKNIRIWELDFATLLGQTSKVRTSHYVNAKVVLLGDTGVGKSGLGLVLNGEPFAPTDSTPGRRVWTFQSTEVQLQDGLEQTRETLLWDLAGQPGYRVIHQLHLNEVAVALIVFDARSETDPLAGVTHWERALRVAQQRRGAVTVPLKKFLVSARADRGAVSISRERIKAVLEEFGFDGYFETSAREGWQIEELRQAIQQAIPWELLPEVSSSVLFADIKAFLLEVKETGRLVAGAAQLYEEFARAHPEEVVKETNLREQFDTCIGRLENRDLIRRLTFGGFVLLQPELLDAYASAMVNAAKKEPDGLGSIAEDVALTGQFYVPDEQKIEERGQEQLLLHATVEELVRHDLALRESATDGRYLVFPSEFIRDYEAAPEPKGKALAITFDGPVQSLYSTLAVRLGHSGLFTTGRAEMWRNAAVFTAKAGGKCGLYLHEFAEARGRLVIFYEEHEGKKPSDETRFNFEEFVLAHAQRRALDGTVDLVRFFVCANGHPVPDDYVRLLTEQGKKTFDCPCGSKVSLTEPKERLHFDSKVEAMEKSADRQRDFEVFVESARGETSTPKFAEWAGDDRATLAIVFTDVVGSTAMGEILKDERMNEVRRAHFAQSQKLIEKYKGREIKTIGDSFMAAFRSVEKALDYAMALQADPGHAELKIRAGIHIGPMTVEENDVFGGAVNFAARVVSAIKEPEIWLSDQAKKDLDGGGQHPQLTWKRQDGVEMKGFNGSFTLWSLEK